VRPRVMCVTKIELARVSPHIKNSQRFDFESQLSTRVEAGRTRGERNRTVCPACRNPSARRTACHCPPRIWRPESKWRIFITPDSCCAPSHI
jgi:hypothetical protein